jgi:hypothetical protein
MSDKKYDFSDFSTPTKREGEKYDFSDFNEPVVPDAPTKTESALGGLTQGATLGFGDELAGTLSALLRPIGITNAGGTLDQIGYESPTLDLDTIKEQYNKTRDAERARFAGQKAENPITFGASELAGGFATPAFGAAKAVGAATKAKGIAQAMKTGAVAGATGNVATNIGEVDELKNIDPTQLATDAAIGGGVGAGLGGLFGTVGMLGSMAKNSDDVQDMSKVFKKSKDGVDLVTVEGRKKMNDDLVDLGAKLEDAVFAGAEKIKTEYGEKIKTLRVGDKAKFEKEIDDFITRISEKEAAGKGFNYVEVETKLKDLQNKFDLTNDDIRNVQAKMADSLKAKRDMTSASSYKKSAQRVDKLEMSAEDLELKKAIDANIRQAQDELIEARRAYQDNPMERASLKLEVRAKEDALRQVRREAKDMGFDTAGNKLGTTKDSTVSSILDKSNTDVLTQVDPLRTEMTQLQKNKIQIARDIQALLVQKQKSNNPAFSKLVDELQGLKATGPSNNLDVIKDVNLREIENQAKLLSSSSDSPLMKEINDIVRRNMGGAKDLDAGYKKMKEELKILGIDLPDDAAGAVKSEKVADSLASQFKAAGKKELGPVANTLNTIERVIDKPEVSDLMNLGRDIGENFSLSEKVAATKMYNPTLRGAVVAGQTVGAVANSKLAKAASKLGNSSLGKKVQDVMSMPEGDVKNRAIFLLGQQGWFRSVSEEDKK